MTTMELHITGAHAEQELGKSNAFMPVENKIMHMCTVTAASTCNMISIGQECVMARTLARLATACANSHCMV